eukprot:15445999-Alexandrium_andersonii.AAC.1
MAAARPSPKSGQSPRARAGEMALLEPARVRACVNGRVCASECLCVRACVLASVRAWCMRAYVRACVC